MATGNSQRAARGAALSTVYGVVAGGLVVYGLWQMGVGAWEARPLGSTGGPAGLESVFSGIGALLGFAVALVGVANLLNILYGLAAPGVRATAIGASGLLVALFVWVGGIPAEWLDRLVLALLVTAAGLSMSRKALSQTKRNV